MISCSFWGVYFIADTVKEVDARDRSRSQKYNPDEYSFTVHHVENHSLQQLNLRFKLTKFDKTQHLTGSVTTQLNRSHMQILLRLYT